MPCCIRMKRIFLQGLLWLYLLECGFMALSLEPGFLDFDNLPDTNFSCVGKVIGGYYADLETNCQMFHVCTIGQLDEPMDIRFLCLNGTVFDQETRVCERIDEVDCSKSEQFYSLNLELYGNTQPAILEESIETDQPLAIKSTTTTTTTQRPKPKATRTPFYSATTTPNPPRSTSSLGPQVISTHHFPVVNSNSPDIRFNPEEINISLHPGAPPDIRTKSVFYLQQHFGGANKKIVVPNYSENSDSKKLTLTTHSSVFDGENEKLLSNNQGQLIEKPPMRVSTTLKSKNGLVFAQSTPSGNFDRTTPNNLNYGYTYRQTESVPEYHTDEPQNYHYQTDFRPSAQEYSGHLHNSHSQQFKSSTFRNEYTLTTPKPSTTLRNYFVQTVKHQRLNQPYHYPIHRTDKPQRVQLPIPLLSTLPPLTFSSPAPFTLQKHIETKRYTKENQAPQRIIISASASVSDATGRLNYSLGTIGTAHYQEQPPQSYDEYKDEDVNLDPFYFDVPKVKHRSKRDVDKTAIDPTEIIKNEQQAVDVLRFLFDWYKNNQRTPVQKPTTTTPSRISPVGEQNKNYNYLLNKNKTKKYEENNQGSYSVPIVTSQVVTQINHDLEPINENTKHFKNNNEDEEEYSFQNSELFNNKSKFNIVGDTTKRHVNKKNMENDKSSKKNNNTKNKNNKDDLKLFFHQNVEKIENDFEDYVNDNYEPITYEQKYENKLEKYENQYLKGEHLIPSDYTDDEIEPIYFKDRINVDKAKTDDSTQYRMNNYKDQTILKHLIKNEFETTTNSNFETYIDNSKEKLDLENSPTVTPFITDITNKKYNEIGLSTQLYGNLSYDKISHDQIDSRFLKTDSLDVKKESQNELLTNNNKTKEDFIEKVPEKSHGVKDDVISIGADEENNTEINKEFLIDKISKEDHFHKTNLSEISEILTEVPKSSQNNRRGKQRFNGEFSSVDVVRKRRPTNHVQQSRTTSFNGIINTINIKQKDLNEAIKNKNNGKKENYSALIDTTEYSITTEINLENKDNIRGKSRFLDQLSKTLSDELLNSGSDTKFLSNFKDISSLGKTYPTTTESFFEIPSNNIKDKLVDVLAESFSNVNFRENESENKDNKYFVTPNVVHQTVTEKMQTTTNDFNKSQINTENPEYFYNFFQEMTDTTQIPLEYQTDNPITIMTTEFDNVPETNIIRKNNLEKFQETTIKPDDFTQRISGTFYDGTLPVTKTTFERTGERLEEFIGDIKGNKKAVRVAVERETSTSRSFSKKYTLTPLNYKIDENIGPITTDNINQYIATEKDLLHDINKGNTENILLTSTKESKLFDEYADKSINTLIQIETTTEYITTNLPDTTFAIPYSTNITYVESTSSSKDFLTETVTVPPTVFVTSQPEKFTTKSYRRNKSSRKGINSNYSRTNARHRFSTELLTRRPENRRNTIKGERVETITKQSNQLSTESNKNYDKDTQNYKKFKTDAPLRKSASPTQAEITKEYIPTTPIPERSSSIKYFIFNCFGKKINRFYPDLRDCRLFHYCTQGYTKNQLLDMKFVCDLNTYFDDEKLVCSKQKPTRCL